MNKKFRNFILFLLMLAMSVPTIINTDAATVKHDVQTKTSKVWYLHGQYAGTAVTITVDSIPAFCLDSTKLLSAGKNDEITPASIGLDPAAMNKLSLIAWYGYRSKDNPTERDYHLTQNLIWQVTADIRGDSTAKKNNYAYSKQYPTLASMQPWFDSVMKKVNNFNKLPSFDGKTFTAKAGTTLTVPDTNGVLSELTLKKNSSIGVEKSGNNLLIDVSSDSQGTVTIGLDRGMTTQQTETNFVVSKGGTQPVSVCYSGKDPYNSFLKVNVVVDLQLAKKDPNGNLVPDTTFKVSFNSDMSNPIGTYTTGSNGTVKVPNLTIGKTVYIQETSVPAYLKLDNKIYKKTLVYAKDGMNYYTATNEWEIADMRLQLAKKDPNKKLIEGAKFKLSYNSDMSNPIGEYTTGSGGLVIVPGLRKGAKVYIQETYVPRELKLDSTIYEKQLGTDPNILYYFTLENEWNDLVRLKLGKKDHLGNYYSGATFALSYNSDMSDPITETYVGVEEVGRTTVSGLYAGSTVYIQETYVVPHLELDHTIYKIVLDKDPNTLNKFTLQNNGSTPKKLQLAKKDPDGKLVPNTTFEIRYKGDTSGKYWTYTTGENGLVIVDTVYELQTLLIREVDVPDYLELDNKVYEKKLWITDANGNIQKIAANEMYYYTATNDWVKIPLEIAKKDPDGNYVPNTTFALSYNEDMSDLIGEFTTGEDGKVIVPDLVLKNRTVYVQEVLVPKHLELDNTIVPVKLEKNENGTCSYIMENNWNKVPLEIEKRDTDGNPVPNTTFKISYNSDMSNPIGEFTTGSNGKITVENLFVKKVYIQEVSVPDYLCLDDTIYPMELENVEIEPNYYIAVNEYKTGSLKIAKKDEFGEYVAGVSFKISYNSDMSSPIGEYTTGSDGTVTINNLKSKKVYIQEVKVPDHLILDTTIYVKTIKPEDTVIINITNYIKSEYKKQIHVSKTVTGNASDKQKEFKFTVELSDKSLTGKYGDVQFINGRGEFNLKDGLSISITNLSKGIDYMISEETNDDYSTYVKLSTDSQWTNNSVITGILDNSVFIEFKNTKEISVDTGINLNSKTYMIAILLALASGLLFIIKKLNNGK